MEILGDVIQIPDSLVSKSQSIDPNTYSNPSGAQFGECGRVEVVAYADDGTQEGSFSRIGAIFLVFVLDLGGFFEGELYEFMDEAGALFVM